MATLGDYIHLNYENYQKYGLNKKRNSSNNGISLIQQEKNAFKAKVVGRKAQSNYEALEAFYEDMLYNQQSQAHKDMTTILERELYDMLVKWQMDLANGIGAVGSGVNKHSFKFGETEGTHLNNILNLKNIVDKTLTSLKEVGKTNENIERIKELQQVLQQTQKYIEKSKITFSGEQGDFINFSKGKANAGVKNFTKKINECLEALTTIGRAEAMGTGLEYALLAADDNIQSYINGTCDELIDQVLGKEKDKIVMTGIDRHNKHLRSELTKQPTGFKSDTLEITQNGSGISQDSIYKMDVKLNYQGEEYRISAKNYSLNKFLNIHLVSGRPLLSMLLGNLSIPVINHSLNMICSTGSPKSVQQIGYDAIKTIVALDALVGTAQKQGFADTLVINNRSARKVKVIPMSLLAQHLEDMIKITPALENSLANINKKYENAKYPTWVQAKIRVDYLLAKLHAIKISASVNYQNLDRF